MKPLGELARERADAATAAGRPAEPWDDPVRDFNTEAADEMADTVNYLTWSAIQRADTDTYAVKQAMSQALEHQRESYQFLAVAQRLREAAVRRASA